MNNVAYINARLLDPVTGLDAVGSLLVSGKKIVDFGPHLFRNGVPEGMKVVDCKGHCLAPGLFDMRVQLREPGEEHKETLQTATRAAVASGITSMVCLPNTNPVMDEGASVEFVARRARKAALTKIYTYAAITKGLEGKEFAEMGILSEAGAVAFTDGVKSVADALVMRRALSYAATFGLLIIQHSEEPSLATGDMNEGELATRLGLSGISPMAEVIMLERDLRLVELTGGRYHVAHISTAESVEVIRRAKDRGLKVTCDTAPPYFALNELEVKEWRTFAKLSPPLRREEDRRAIVEGLKSGVIDAIASDHAPQDQDSKRLPFAQAAFGGIGLETLLAVSLELYHNGYMSLNQVLGHMTYAPADILGLDGGRLRRGGAADFIVFDLDRPWQVTEAALLSKSKNSPFDKRALQGKVLRTIIDGREVYTYE